MASGATLAWLIEPADRSVTIYRPAGNPETLAAIESVTGEGPVEGLVLNLARVWDPLQSNAARVPAQRKRPRG